MTLSALGIFSAAGAGAGVGDYELIQTQILGSTQASISFDVSSFASTYKHLQIRLLARSTTSPVNQFIRLNGDSGNNYKWHWLEGSGSSVSSGNSGASAIGFCVTHADSNNFTASVIDILDAFSTTKNTTVRAFSGSARSGTNWLGLYSGAWFNTASVTSIGVGFGSESLVAGSRFSLYGIRG